MFSRAGGPRRHQELLRRPEDAPGGPHKVPGGRFIRVFTCRRGARTLMIRVFTCQRGPRRAQEADPYVFLRVFLESGRGPRMVQETGSNVFYRVFLACGPHHTCFYVSAVVSRRVGVVSRRSAPLLFLAFWWPFGRIIRENTCRERWPRNRLSIESYAL